MTNETYKLNKDNKELGNEVSSGAKEKAVIQEDTAS